MEDNGDTYDPEALEERRSFSLSRHQMMELHRWRTGIPQLMRSFAAPIVAIFLSKPTDCCHMSAMLSPAFYNMHFRGYGASLYWP